MLENALPSVQGSLAHKKRASPYDPAAAICPGTYRALVLWCFRGAGGGGGLCTYRADMPSLGALAQTQIRLRITRLAGTAAILCTEGLDVIRKEAWSFYRTISGVRVCWEPEEPKGPEGKVGFIS